LTLSACLRLYHRYNKNCPNKGNGVCGSSHLFIRVYTKEAARAAHRLAGLNMLIRDSTESWGHLGGWGEALRECPELLMKQDRVPPTLLSSGPLKFVVPEREDWELFQNSILPTHGWFTDGSKTVTGAGAGAGVYGATSGTRPSFTLDCHCTIFQAEIFAIIRCGEFILNSPLRRKDTFICTEGKAAMAALKADSTTSALVLECKKTLLSLMRMAKVRLTWVPGQSVLMVVGFSSKRHGFFRYQDRASVDD